MLRVQDERHVQRLGHGRAALTVLVACHQVQQVLRKISTLVLSVRDCSGHDSITMRDQQRDLAVEEREQQGADVTSIDIGVRVVAAEAA